MHTYTRLAVNGGTTILQTEDANSPLSDLIKVTQDMGKAKTKAKYWISEQDVKGGYHRPTTAMFSTSQVRWLYGDIDDKKHLMIFESREQGNVLRLYFFKDFYPKSPKRFVIKFIKR